MSAYSSQLDAYSISNKYDGMQAKGFDVPFYGVSVSTNSETFDVKNDIEESRVDRYH